MVLFCMGIDNWKDLQKQRDYKSVLKFISCLMNKTRTEKKKKV